MNIVFDRMFLDKAAANACKHILAYAVCPTKLFKIHRAHNNVLYIPHRKEEIPLNSVPSIDPEKT